MRKHISSLCNKASNKLNAIRRIQKFIGLKEKDNYKIAFSIQNLIPVFSWKVA